MYLECGVSYKKIVEQVTKRGLLFVKSQLSKGNPHPTNPKYIVLLSDFIENTKARQLT